MGSADSGAATPDLLPGPKPHPLHRPLPTRVPAHRALAQRLAAGVGRRADELRARPDAVPLAILHLAITVSIVVFGRLVLWRHNRFGTFDHDLGIWDQAVWLLARGGQFITVRGLDVFGFHASPGLYLLAPLSWLGAGPNTLNLLMVGTVALGAVPLYRIGLHYLDNSWHALVPALAFLCHHSNQWMAWETFHPEPIAVSAMLAAYLAALQGRWRAYGLWLVLAVSWKEDIALAAIMLGLVLAIRDRRTVGSWLAARKGEPTEPGPAGTRRAGVITIVAAGFWFLLATQVLIPGFSPGGNFTENLFGDLGSSPVEIASTFVTQPEVVADHLESSDPVDYTRRLTGSYGFVPLLAPTTLLLGLPQALINLLAVYDFFWTTRFHYVALPLFATSVSAVEGLARLRYLPLRRAALGAMAVGAFFTAVNWGLSPVSPDYRQGFWPLDPDPQRQAAMSEAVARPDPDDTVSAVYLLVPHLSHRERIYTFPNPWKPLNWGVSGENRPDPATVDWLILDPAIVGPEDKATLMAALDDPDRLYEFDAAAEEEAQALDVTDPSAIAELVDTDEWTIVTLRADLLVLERTGGRS